MLPVLAITDPDDARIVFDALNNHYQSLPLGESRDRALVLLIAAHAEINRTPIEIETGS